ncbi:hypothetical protein H8356DRAFT_1082495 [Neocallimastix lanati (nom. inval.)]|uniref:Uncharacterized protein n=1 Tax=Neocallimastix californiae TaxID=1754190 RepID=A0A1Y1ZH15_9FUNG|nr:hypothetical protein H8356DRAFT_972237 [Neocallimastix sp. JGI-2020a]KAG4091889.1 hypothetical protein H8356DRAFT_1082495 [Neocallimastix sp. JGI-2020a]ORY09546.1 hypothetical protein LY90DRAFT_518854 [Neocallimastix californiae]|eukprot:ORY09546.1 hypothetical protein LY90DRAFT_518854 [Neocallimastix californiae]
MNKLLNEIIIKERNNIPKLYEPTISYHDNYEFELLLKNEYLLLLKFNKDKKINDDTTLDIAEENDENYDSDSTSNYFIDSYDIRKKERMTVLFTNLIKNYIINFEYNDFENVLSLVY